jgi:hypothetical protein
LSSHKEGGQVWYQWIRLHFVHNRRRFLETLKGMPSGFKLHKTSYNATKKSEEQYDLEVQPTCQ